MFVGIVGIDEVVLGRKVFRTDKDWKRYKPIIETEVKKWKKHVKKINRIHTSTISDKQQIIDYLKVPEEQIDIIPYGVDHDMFKPAEDKSKTPPWLVAAEIVETSRLFARNVAQIEASWLVT